MLNGIILAVIALLAVAGVVVYEYRRKARPSKAQLGEWFDYLSKKPASGTSKAFRATTARLSEDDYDRIKLLYPPKLMAEWEERFNKLRNEFAIRALEIELEARREFEAEDQSPTTPPLSERQ